MASNSTEKPVATGPRSSTLVIAIIIPSVLIVLLVVLIIVSVLSPHIGLPCSLSELTNSNRHRGFLLPRLVREELRVRENRLKTRQEELESNIKSQDFCEWLASQKERKSGAHQMSDPLW